MDFQTKWVPIINDSLIKIVSDSSFNPKLSQMMKYTINTGGKRIRPLLFLASLSLFNLDIDEDCLKIAASIEMIHTYSLVHDDLPEMDNDDMRRGQPTVHKKYGNAQAILAGDALLTQAFSVLSNLNISSDIVVKLVQRMSLAAGPTGMISGQLLDIEGNNNSYSLDQLTKLHQQKTGHLISVAGRCASIILGDKINMEASGHLQSFFESYGLAFQIYDDILDQTKSSKILGKTANKDLKYQKNTYVSHLGLVGSQRELDNLVGKMDSELSKLHQMNPNLNLTGLKELKAYFTEVKN